MILHKGILMVLSNFSAGIMNRANLHKVPLPYAEISHNNDSSQISLVPILGTVDTGKILAETGFYSECLQDVVAGSSETYWTETCNRLFTSNPAGITVSCKDIPTRPLGVVPPTHPLTATVKDTAITGTLTLEEARPLADLFNKTKALMAESNEVMTSDEALRVVHKLYPAMNYTASELQDLASPNTLVNAIYLSKTPENTKLNGIYSYRYTYVNSDNVESAPSPSTGDIECINSTISIIGIIPSTNSSVTKIRIYRLGGLSNEYTLLLELDNVTTSITDDMPDKDVAVNRVLSTYNELPPELGVKYITYRLGRLYASKGNTLFFSNAGNLDAWNCYNTISFMSDITGIGTDGNILLVFTADSTYMVAGNTIDDFSVVRVSSEYGCINHRTIRILRGAMTWVSKKGINTYSGRVLLLTNEVFGVINIEESINAEVYNDMYHVSLTSKHQGKQTLILDYRFSPAVRTISTYGFFIKYPDGLYVLVEDKLLEMYKGEELPLEYSTGMVSEGGESLLKNYKSLYIHYETNEELYVQLLADTTRGIIVINEYKLDKKEKHETLQLKDSIDMYGIQITIKGRGKVHEIALTPSARKAR